MPVTRHRAAVLLATVLIGLGVLLSGVPGPASAAPGPGAADDEGGTEALRRDLDKATAGYNNARAKAQTSQKRRSTLVTQIANSEKRITVLEQQVQDLGAAAYRQGLPDPATAMANSRSLPDMIGNVGLVESLARQRQQTLDDLLKTRSDLVAARRQVDSELTKQRTEEKTMGERRADAEEALRKAKVGGQKSGGFTSDGENKDVPAATGNTSQAAPEKKTTRKKTRKATSSPRRGDGSFGNEGCSQDDPTSGGCLTPRTLHALQQTKAAGFTHYVHCFRQASFGEHPKGRACDFAAAPGGFGGAATGNDRAYGNRLAAWFVDNADRLGVLYVIWYRQIWLPGSGWRAYQSGSDPSAAHTNHVHLSVQ
ncbi:coiled-coil domain-containing protein [Cryptosporangium sp. NPDC048952]|uniref:coiled-coil domain-containing protein n=1 Tax=Cryptosporangium sp. NPDC048952 TaxID=3363961 RepID=UPI0037120701